MKLILMKDEIFKTRFKDKSIYQESDMIISIDRKKTHVDKSRYTENGPVSKERLFEIINENIFRTVGFVREPKSETFKTANCIKDTPDNSVGYEDPELSNVYQDQKIWCIAYDTGFKNIELLETGVYTTKQKAEDVAKEMSESDMFRGTELTVIGIPIKNIDYGDTFLSTKEDDGLVEISDELFFELAKQAHKENLTVNELANKLLCQYIDKNENEKINDEDKELNNMFDQLDDLDPRNFKE